MSPETRGPQDYQTKGPEDHKNMGPQDQMTRATQALSHIEMLQTL